MKKSLVVLLSIFSLFFFAPFAYAQDEETASDEEVTTTSEEETTDGEENLISPGADEETSGEENLIATDDTEEKDDNNWILYIGIGAVGIAVLVVVGVMMTGEKKQ